MSETSENPTVRSSTATAPAPAAAAAALYRTPRVFIAAAWAAIVAWIVSIASVISSTGMVLGSHGHHRHHHHHHHAMLMHPHRFGGPDGGPGANAPGAPAAVTPGAPGPSQIPSSVAPSRTP